MFHKSFGRQRLETPEHRMKYVTAVVGATTNTAVLGKVRVIPTASIEAAGQYVIGSLTSMSGIKTYLLFV